MAIGIAFFSWDQKKGAVLGAKYPQTFDLSDTLINKIYTTHVYSQDLEKVELIETNYEEQVIFSYCEKKRVADVGYEILILIIHEREKINSYNIKRNFINFSKKIILSPINERNRAFLEEAISFFKKGSAKKILLLGRASVGKTTIKKILFEGNDPRELLYKPLAPTRGITPSVHSWLDLDLGIFDSSGQELPFLLRDEKEQKIAFENTDAIIYLFDFQIWVDNSQEIIDEIQDILDIIEKNSYKSELIVFLHKIDLMREKNQDKILSEIKNTIENQLQLPIYFTSIYPNLIYSLYNAFYEILSSFSEETITLKTILDEKISDFSKIMCFITNQHNSIIVQTMATDFNTALINHSHKLIAQLTQTFEDMSEHQINHVIISSPNELNIILVNLNLKKFDVKNLICITEGINVNNLIILGGQIRARLNRYLYIK